MIREVIVTTVSAAGKPHVAPFGLIAAEPDEWVIAPFHPSTTLDNLREIPFLVANYTDDVRIFAGCLTGRRDWPCVPSTKVPPPRLAAALAHAEMAVFRSRKTRNGRASVAGSSIARRTRRSRA